jgi:hypothetical protein
MVRRMEELAMFLVVNSGTKYFGNNSIFTFLLTVVCFYTDFCICFLSYWYGVGDIFMSVFQMELNDYPHFNLTEDGRLCSTGQHYPEFLRLLYDTLNRFGYDGDAPVFHCRLSTAHGMDQCKVSVPITFASTEPWLGCIISNEPDTGIETMAHITLT